MTVAYGGTCHVFFAFEAGFAIDLSRAQLLLAEGAREGIAMSPRNLGGSDFHPQPLRVVQRTEPVSVGQAHTTGEVRTTLYDFGAVSVWFQIPLDGRLESLVPLSRALFNNRELRVAALQAARDTIGRIAPAVAKPRVVEQTEDYVVYALGCSAAGASAAGAGAESLDRSLVARILRAEEGALSQEEASDAFSQTVRYGEHDMAVIDWNAALLLDDDPAGAIAVLEYANTELLEMRHLDNELDDWLQEAYELSAQHLRKRRPIGTRIRRDASRLAELQIDAATLFESVNNALKLLGDQYLARVHACAVRRFHTHDYERSVLRKIETLESIYEKMKDNQAQVRLEILEWIIIVLIAAEIALSLLRG